MSTSLNSGSKQPASTLIENGEAVYEKLRAALESRHSGAFVAIEPSTARYFLGETATSALVSAINTMPNGRFSLTRVGRNFAHKV